MFPIFFPFCSSIFFFFVLFGCLCSVFSLYLYSSGVVYIGGLFPITTLLSYFPHVRALPFLYASFTIVSMQFCFQKCGICKIICTHISCERKTAFTVTIFECYRHNYAMDKDIRRHTEHRRYSTQTKFLEWLCRALAVAAW